MSNAALGPQVASQTMGFYTTDVPFEVAKARFLHHMDGCLLLQWMAFVDSLIRWMLRFSMSFFVFWANGGINWYRYPKIIPLFFFKGFQTCRESGKYAKSGAYDVACKALITPIKPHGRHDSSVFSS